MREESVKSLGLFQHHLPWFKNCCKIEDKIPKVELFVDVVLDPSPVLNISIQNIGMLS